MRKQTIYEFLEDLPEELRSMDPVESVPTTATTTTPEVVVEVPPEPQPQEEKVVESRPAPSAEPPKVKSSVMGNVSSLLNKGVISIPAGAPDPAKTSGGVIEVN